ncbi:MAG: fimbria/pilus periplasmic chaperone [Gammaproteobacteria bacterium]|nr:fimbria/pilus periplasmic chaperone [Gammaproteobacteria bacterium]
MKKLFLGALALLASHSASALDFSSTRIDLNARQLVGELTIGLPQGAKSQQYEATLLSWKVLAGKDVTQATNELVLIPRRFTLRAGEQKTLRLGLLSPSHLPQSKEATYRILVKPLKTSEEGVGVSVGYSLPVFVAPQRSGGPDIFAEIVQAPSGLPVLRIRNQGISHSVVQGLALVEQNEAFGEGRFYLLADRYRDVPLPSGLAAPGCLEIRLKRVNLWEQHTACPAGQRW